MSLKERILNYLLQYSSYDKEKWVGGIEIERLALEAGKKPSNASRRCRELHEEGKINRKLDRGFVWYRAI